MTKNKLLCMGDSLTEGYGIQQECSWPHLLRGLLQVEVVNCGISGDTTAGMLARFDPALKLHCPSHAIIMGGTNDLWLDLPFNQILSNLMAMTRQARAANCHAIVGIPTPCFFETAAQIDDDIFLNQQQLADRIESFQSYLKKAMQIDGLAIIDFGNEMTQPLFLPDGVHPNVKGNAQMAQTAHVVMKKIFS